jgi:DNA mismatch repair protein MutS
MIAVGVLLQPAARRVFLLEVATVRRSSRTVAGMTKQARPNIINFDSQRRQGASTDFMSDSGHDPSRFYSILFRRPADRVGDDTLGAPEFFADLNCDQIVDAITAGKDEYNLKPFFHACLPRVEAIQYRHEVMQDLERPPLYERVTSFAGKMRELREHLIQVQKMYYQEQKQAWFLGAVYTYCEAIKCFAAEVADLDFRSRGFSAFRDYLDNYSRSARFSALLSQTKKLKADLAAVEYCILIKTGGFTVRKYEGEVDYSAEVERTFNKFKQGAVKDIE